MTTPVAWTPWSTTNRRLMPWRRSACSTWLSCLRSRWTSERISDHALNIAQIGEEKANEGIPFTADAMEGLEQIYEKVYENVGAAARMLGAEEGDQFEEMADDIWDREDEVDGIEVRLRRRHVERLREGGCEPNAGVLYVTLLSNFERISDHCTNIAEDVQGPMQRFGERRDAPG